MNTIKDILTFVVIFILVVTVLGVSAGLIQTIFTAAFKFTTSIMGNIL